MIGDMIKKRRTELGLTQTQLATATGIGSTTISNYENNVSTPNETNILKLMQGLRCDANYLYEWTDVSLRLDCEFAPEEKAVITKYRTLDRYGKKAVGSVLDIEYERCSENGSRMIELPLCELPVSAGTGEFLSEEMSKIISIPETPLGRSADFIVQVNGDSMQPDFNDDDYLLVRKQETVEKGEIGIFVLNGCGYVKKFGGDRLISLNKKYNDIELGEFDNIVCYGKVLGKV